MLVKITKDLDGHNQTAMISWLFENFGSPPHRWRLQNLNAVWFEDMEDGVYFKLVWNQL